jgi:hypothetical protein
MSFTKVAAALGAVIALSSLSSAPAQAEDRRVRIINATHHTIVRFYASNSSTTQWGRDHLGEAVLPSGQAHVFDFDDGSGACLFDFKAVFDDGDELTRSQVNVCQITEYRYTE